MKKVLVLLAALVSTQALAAGDVSCSYLERHIDAVRKAKWSSDLSPAAARKLKLEQLRGVLAHHGLEGLDGLSFNELNKLADGAIFADVQIGRYSLQMVNIAQGDNPFVYFYHRDTLALSELTILDGTVASGRDFCDADLEEKL